VELIEQWLIDVFFEKKNINATYLDAILLTTIAKLEIIISN